MLCENYDTIAVGFTDVLCKPTFTWTLEATASFQQLKSTMIQIITLALPDFTSSFDVTIDASNMAIAVILSQKY